MKTWLKECVITKFDNFKDDRDKNKWIFL